MIVLGIDTSCDDTSVGIVQDQQVLANIISSQDELHAPWGGVVPNIAREAHEANFPLVYQQALAAARIAEEDIDAIAVTYGHGLAVALEVGLTEAKTLARRLNKPLYAINHSEGHFVANFAGSNPSTSLSLGGVSWPGLAILVAGGQTQLVEVAALGQYRIIGETVDDAMGEAFDKSARLLGLGYPGGAELSQLASQGNAQAYPLPRPMRGSGDLNVSYAGLKTAFLRLVREVTGQDTDVTATLTQTQKADLAASFQLAAVETLVHKVQKALEQQTYRHLYLGGGVAANQLLREQLAAVAEKHHATLHVPENLKLCRDNGAMIALAGFFMSQRLPPVENLDTLDRDPQLRLE